jgi:hypothetical protein
MDEAASQGAANDSTGPGYALTGFSAGFQTKHAPASGVLARALIDLTYGRVSG